jgi:hypothetical protein
MHEQIVKKIASEGVTAHDSHNQTTDHFVEPSLLPQPNQLLPSFPITDWSNTFSQYLVKRVRRNPRDLRAHVQRTLLCLSKHDSDAIYAALIDLFLILGNRGFRIRTNLLKKALPFLQTNQFQFLVKHLKSGLNTNEPLPPNTYSSLSRGYCGTTYIVRRKTKNSDQPDANPLEQAKERYRQNDWLSAIVILENALYHDPGDDAVCNELLLLYKQQNTRDAFYRTYTGLFGRSLALPEMWRETELFFLNSARTTN